MISTLYAGGYDEPNIGNESGSWGVGANLKNGLNCHEPSHFVGWATVAGATGYALERRPVGGAWAEVYRGASAIYLDNIAADGWFEYRWKPLGLGGIEGQWSDPLHYFIKPKIFVATVASKNCDTVTVSWTNLMSASRYRVFVDNFLVQETTSTRYSVGFSAGGLANFTIKAVMKHYNNYVPSCVVEASVTAVLQPLVAPGTILRSGCVGNQNITVTSDGNCGEISTVTKTWECNGCFDILRGEVGPRFCQGNEVAIYAYQETCSNNIYTKILEACAGTCLNGACLPLFDCSVTNQEATGLGLPSPVSWEAQYSLGNIHTDGVCVNAWWVNKGNNVQLVEVYLNDMIVCAATLSGDTTARYVLRPGWSSATYPGGGQKDPSSHTYTKWQGNVRIRVYADGTIGQGYGSVRLEAISWRNI